MIFKQKAKKIPSVFLICAIFFVSVFACTYASALNKNDYTPRITAPSYDDYHYYSDNNIFYKYGYSMPNCTAYAWGRAYEILGEVPNLCVYSAYEWYNYKQDGYERGLTPKLGAIACWYYYNGDGSVFGHVAVVEKIENNTITFSNSAWGWQEFYLTEASIYDENPGQSNWIFQGYIYIGDFSQGAGPVIKPTDPTSPTDSTGSTTPEPPQPITYLKGKYVVDVSDFLNVRSNATTSSNIIGRLYSGDEIVVTEIKENAGYTWGKFNFKGQAGWIALEYCKYVEEYTPDDFKLGDVNLDGTLSVTDITNIQLYLAAQLTFNDTQVGLADFDNSGNVDIYDVTAIQLYLVNNI